MKTYIVKTILSAIFLIVPTLCFAETKQTIKPSDNQTKTAATVNTQDKTKVKAQQTADELLEPGEIRLVYPSEAINYALADETYARKNAKPPVDEDEDENTDVETPIGQVRKIRDSLEQIQKEQKTTLDLLEDFQGSSERTDEILNAIDRIKLPADRTNDLLDSFGRQFETIQQDLANIVNQKFQETNEIISTQFAETAQILKADFEKAVVDFEAKVNDKIAESELKNAELLSEQIDLIKADIATSMESALDSAFEKALLNASEKLDKINTVPKQITFLTIIDSFAMLVIIALVCVLISDKMQTRREQNRLKLREEAKAELLAEYQAKKLQQQKQNGLKNTNDSSNNSTIES